MAPFFSDDDCIGSTEVGYLCERSLESKEVAGIPSHVCSVSCKEKGVAIDRVIFGNAKGEPLLILFPSQADL